ncbi:hypothetical protein LF1_37870 [Rubripirellula obstinata]|uniref:Prepilin-type N-terminal cleavage/methylation domain-containing protein n=1 Tax=Rubripirellula obstinata TaxID=406547 RepID=A0A5B1CLT2_9BACT|nr:prepilin-type N-terminal cleavage/methylation domain-containing protein [Rubripirellula obstinata]KAA1261241.1 hypothetical protein LF1_37870 [Rubripirellula obstinata]
MTVVGKERLGADRQAYTLLEMVVVLSLMGMLLGGTVMLMTVIRQSERDAAKALLHRREIVRFADELRGDVLVASDVQIADDQVTIEQSTRDKTIVYQADGLTMISRSVSSGADSGISNDTYTVGQRSEFSSTSYLDRDGLVWTLTATDRPDLAIEILALRGARR